MQVSVRHAGRCVFCDLRSHLTLVRRQQLNAARALSTSTSAAAATSRSPRGSSSVLRMSYDGPGIRKYKFNNSGSNEKSNEKSKGRRWTGREDPRTSKKRFPEVLQERLQVIKEELSDAPITKQLPADGPSFNQLWRAFVDNLTAQASRPGADNSDRTKEYRSLKDAYFDRGISSLDDRLKYVFYDHVTGSRFSDSDIRNQKAMADLRYPIEWYPDTRIMHRTIHLHVGPTNSGKTYHALQRLEQAEKGVYAGPLRLLAHEVYTRLNAKGKRCTLITGEERRSPDDSMQAPLMSCTVEMTPLNIEMDVAVIDEIQMIGNSERGWAWTQAVLGIRAAEVHLCGEARTVPLIRELCASAGEKLVVHEYKRLSPLKVAETSLNGDLKQLRKGDCIVSFSIMGIHALRRQIEMATNKKVAIVYGSLPPETRAQQARLFNDPDNDYDFLVASDAIGMGLNLSIKRVIFETASKFNGYREEPLPIADVKQIGGRAGRYRSAHQDNESAKRDQVLETPNNEDNTITSEQAQSIGDASSTTETVKEGISKNAHVQEESSEVAYQSPKKAQTQPKSSHAETQSRPSTVGIVTTLDKFDLPAIAAAMKAEPEPIRSAGIFPPASVVERFATYFPPGTPFSYVLMRLHELSQVHSRFHLCGLRDQLWIADIIEPIQGLTTTDRVVLCACPASKSESALYKKLLPAFARCIERQSGGSLLDIAEIPLEILELEISPNREYLRQLEQLHRSVVAYLWLSYRFSGIFTTRPLAFHVKAIVEEKIEQVLGQFSFTQAQRLKIKAAREKAYLESLKRDAEERALGSKPDEVVKEVSDPETQTGVTEGGGRFGGEDEDVLIDPAEEAGLDESVTVSEAAAKIAPVGTTDLPPDNHTGSREASLTR